MSEQSDKISQADLQRIFSINSTSTIYRYVREGILTEPVESPYGEMLFDRQQICAIAGIKEIPNEPFLTTKEAFKILQLSPKTHRSNIRPYCKRMKIPYYTFSNSKGSKTYFIQSELEAFMKYTAVWGTDFPDFVASNMFLREIFKVFLHPSNIKGLKDVEQAVLEGAFLQNKSLTDMAKGLLYSKERTRQILIIACKRVYYSVKQLEAKLKVTDETIAENIRLNAQNKYLTAQLKIEPEESDRISTSFNPIDVYNLPPRMKSLINAMEAKTLSDVAMFRRSDVEKFRNAGKKTIDSLEDLLKENGLTWKDEPLPVESDDSAKEVKKLVVKSLSKKPSVNNFAPKPLPEWFDEKTKFIVKGLYKEDRVSAMSLIYETAEKNGGNLPDDAKIILDWVKKNKNNNYHI